MTGIKRKTIETVQSSAEWHAHIAKELANPVAECVSTETSREIEAQRERHELFAKSLAKLAAATKPGKKRK